MAYTVMAYAFMAYVVVAYVVMAYIVMTYIFMAYIVMAYIVMAYVVMVVAPPHSSGTTAGARARLAPSEHIVMASPVTVRTYRHGLACHRQNT